MKKIAILFLSSIFIFASCKDKMVCAAFQSSYILDEEKQTEKFSYFKNDSLVLEASLNTNDKNIYGLSEKEYGYWQKQRLLKVEQNDVYSDEVDSLLDTRGEKPEEMAESGVDSLIAQRTDSLQFEEGEDAWDNTKRFNYNVDFVKYMLLVGNDVLLRQAAARDSAEAKQEREQPLANDSSGENSENKGGFFKNLFKGKADKNNGDNEPAVKEENYETAAEN